MTENQDIYRGHYPRAFVFLGGKLVMVKEFDLTTTLSGECGSANVTLSLDNIDSSLMFADENVVGGEIPIDIWAGYLQDDLTEQEQMNTLLNQIVKKEHQKFFTKRFSGFVTQPEWKVGNGGKWLHCACQDWSGILREVKFTKNLEGGQTEARQIVSLMNSQLVGLQIELAPYSGSVKLGRVDEEEHKILYHCVGKSYFEILKEIATNLGRIMIVDGGKVKIVAKKDNPLEWTMYYGQYADLHVNGIPRGQMFSEICWRYGAKGKIDKGNVVVEATGLDIKKKGKDKKLRVIFPEDSALLANTKFERIHISGDTNKQQLKVVAEEKYKELSKRLITGTIDLPFANHFMSLQDIIKFDVDNTENDFVGLAKFSYTVNAINEKYGMEGYSQSIEFDSDPTLVNNNTRNKVLPKGFNPFDDGLGL